MHRRILRRFARFVPGTIDASYRFLGVLLSQRQYTLPSRETRTATCPLVSIPETERVFQNLSAVLKAASKSFDDVVRAGVFLTNMTDFAAMNGIYAKYFSQPFPARTTIAAAALPLGACVEIDLVVKA